MLEQIHCSLYSWFIVPIRPYSDDQYKRATFFIRRFHLLVGCLFSIGSCGCDSHYIFLLFGYGDCSSDGSRPLRGRFVPPKPQDVPAGLSKACVGIRIASTVGFDFPTPEIGVLFGPRGVLWTSVPKAPIDKDGDLQSWNAMSAIRCGFFMTTKLTR